MKQVFIINGSGGVGKDLFVDMVNRNLQPGHSVMNYSSVDKVKEIAKMIGWDGGKTEKDRKMLSDLKLLCTEYNDMPFACMTNAYEMFKDNPSYDMLFLHIREPKEIERAKNAFGAKTILVVRNSVEHITSNMADAGVNDYEYDILINNDGDKKDYADKAARFVDDFSKYCLRDIY